MDLMQRLRLRVKAVANRASFALGQAFHEVQPQAGARALVRAFGAVVLLKQKDGVGQTRLTH